MSALKYVPILCSLLMLAASCKKDPAIPRVQVAGGDYGFACQDTSFDRTPLKPDPFGLVYHYTSSPGKRAVWRVLYDPVDPNLIYYLTTEAGSDQHYLWKYNRLTKVKTFLDKDVLNTVNVSKTGWLTYDKFDWNVYVIKTNGDSLTRIPSSDPCLYPSWSSDGNYIYFYMDSPAPLGPKMYKADKHGNIVDTLKNVATTAHVFETTDNLYYYRYESSVSSIVQKHIATGIDKIIETGDGSDNFYTDNGQNWFYYTNDEGLYKVNLHTLQKEKLVNSGLGSLCQLIYFRRSPFTGNFLAVELQDSLVNVNTILSTSYIMEFSPDGKCRHRVEIPD